MTPPSPPRFGSQIAEHALRVLVAAFHRSAGEADERRLGQRVPHVLGEAINEIVLAAVRFVGDDDNVAAVGKQRVVAAFFIGKEFLKLPPQAIAKLASQLCSFNRCHALSRCSFFITRRLRGFHW